MGPMSFDFLGNGLGKVLADDSASALFDLGLRPKRNDRSDRPGDCVAHYRLVSLLGEGGFGSVWSAEQLEPIQREIALKLIKLGMDSQEVIARFEAESQALAMMDHPNIAAVLDVGTTSDGRPFFAMELVKGVPLTSYCDSRNLSVRERLELFIPVCHAVQHAHQKAILHRDLKPSNILVTEVDGKAMPMVIDFGISKALTAPAADALTRTRLGSFLGTPQYMSPEQTGSVTDVDTRSDIYSLGVILYELLTGRTPLGEEAESYEETLRHIRVEEPPKPSSTVHPHTEAAKVLATARGTEPAKLRKLLRGDLDWIAIKALEKDRRHRYETATSLAADLRRYLESEPVSAAAPTLTYRFSKFARRQRAAFATVGLVSATLIAGTGVSLWQAAEARRARISSEQNRAQAQLNFGKARDAVEKYLSRVTANPRLKEADFHGLRTELLETALPFYEELAAYTGVDPTLRYDKAQALGDLGSLYNDLGESLKAIDSLREAIRIEEELVAEFPGNTTYRESLAVHCNNFGPLTSNQEALRILNRGLAILQGLREQFPDNNEYAQGWASTMINVAVIKSRTGDTAGSEEAMIRALETFEKIEGTITSDDNTVGLRVQLAIAQANAAIALGDGTSARSEQLYRSSLASLGKAMEEFPGILQVRTFWANTAHNYGMMLASTGRSDEAIPLFKSSIAVHRQTVANYPDLPANRHSLAMVLHSLGDTLTFAKREKESREYYEEALVLFRKLNEDHPLVFEYPRRAAMSLDRLGQMKLSEGKWPEAADLFTQAVSFMQQAIRKTEDDAQFRTELRHLHGKLSFASIRNGDPILAANSMIEVAGLLDSGSSWEDCERCTLQLAAIIPMLEEKHPALATECAEKAAEAMQKAINDGYPAMNGIHEDSRLTPLRRYPGFQHLKPAPVDPVDRSPSRFTFYYAHDDPGKRIWSRTGEFWTEEQPSGTRNVFKVMKRSRVFGISGTEVAREDQTGIRLFIPDMGTRPPALLRIMSGENDWGNLGEIKDIE